MLNRLLCVVLVWLRALVPSAFVGGNLVLQFHEGAGLVSCPDTQWP